MWKKSRNVFYGVEVREVTTVLESVKGTDTSFLNITP